MDTQRNSGRQWTSVHGDFAPASEFSRIECDHVDRRFRRRREQELSCGIVGKSVPGAGKVHPVRDPALKFVVDLKIGVMPTGVGTDNPTPFHFEQIERHIAPRNAIGS